MSNPSTFAIDLNNASKLVATDSLISQGYANSVIDQPNVDFLGDKLLVAFAEKIDSQLDEVKTESDSYLNDILPTLIKIIADIENYYSIHSAVVASIKKSAAKDQWDQCLSILQSTASNCHNQVVGLTKKMELYMDKVNKDSANFKDIVVSFNKAIYGNEGVMDSLNEQISGIDSSINDYLAGLVSSSLGEMGGIFLIVIGAVANFVMEETSKALVISGVIMLVAGIAVNHVAMVKIKSLMEQKGKVFEKKAKVKSESKMAYGMSKGFQNFSANIVKIYGAVNELENEWYSLIGFLVKTRSDLSLGLISTELVYQSYMTAKPVVKNVLSDANTIREQMSGVNLVKAKAHEKVSDAALNQLKPLNH